MFSSNKKIKQLIKLLSKPREMVLCLLPGHPHPTFISCPLPGHTHLALLLLLLVCTHSFTPAPWSYPSGLVAPTCSCPLIHSDSFAPAHSCPLVCPHSFTPAPWSHLSGLVAPTHSCPLVCSNLVICWFLLVPATWSHSPLVSAGSCYPV